MKPGELRANSKNILTDEKRRYYSKILDPGVLLINPGLAKKVCRRSGIKCLAIGQVNQALEFQLVEIAHQVQWNLMRSKVHPGGGATHQLQDIFLALRLHSMHSLIANILGQRKLAGGCTAKGIQVIEVFGPKYECMGALKEYQWDAKGNTYGNLLIRIGEGDYFGGETFMDHGRACFSLLKHEAAVWATYDGHGQLLGESVHAAGTVYGAVQSCWWRPCGRCVVSIARLASISRRASPQRGRERVAAINGPKGELALDRGLDFL
jgi:hypothetical protein